VGNDARGAEGLAAMISKKSRHVGAKLAKTPKNTKTDSPLTERRATKTRRAGSRRLQDAQSDPLRGK
jgi:hypothetical protein